MKKDLLKPVYTTERKLDRVATGEQIREYRIRYGLSLHELAAGLALPPNSTAEKMTRQLLQYYESGRGVWTEEYYTTVRTTIEAMAAARLAGK